MIVGLLVTVFVVRVQAHPWWYLGPRYGVSPVVYRAGGTIAFAGDVAGNLVVPADATPRVAAGTEIDVHLTLPERAGAPLPWSSDPPDQPLRLER